MPKIKPPHKGYERQWVECKRCKQVSYYDFVPYSIGNPIKILPCGHNVTQMWNDSVNNISADEAIAQLNVSV